MTFERVGLIGKIEVLRTDKDVFITILGRKPDPSLSLRSLRSGKPRWWRESPGNRWADLTPSQARRLACRLIDAASKVERKLDRHGFWGK